jgi:hypothetical protein
MACAGATGFTEIGIPAAMEIFCREAINASKAGKLRK